MTETLEYAIRSVHNGVAMAYTRAEIECNAYCKPPVHCDVWYNQLEEENRGFFIDLLQQQLGRSAEILEVKRTLEAQQMVPEFYVGYGEQVEGQSVNAWLVFWKLR